MEISIDRQRLLREFEELVSVDAESFGERKIADILTCKLKELGFAVYEDNAGEIYGGNAGNIYGYLKGSGNGASLLFSAHMDTVSPGLGKRAVIREDGTITSEGDTVLGADDAAGLAEILEGIRCVKESGKKHRDIEILFPIAEEAYLKGTEKFDFSRIKAKEAYVFDLSGDIGSAAIKAPSLISFVITVTGKAAHAGFEPENGVNAIEITAKALADLRQGHTDHETTLNIGTITGGTATNIVSEKCVCTGEVRSFCHSKAMDEINKLEKAFSYAAKDTGASFQIDISVHMEAYSVSEKSRTVKNFLKACRGIGRDGKLISTFGGSDNHNFIKNGIDGIVVSCGMYNVHSVQEFTKIEELVKGAELAALLILEE